MVRAGKHLGLGDYGRRYIADSYGAAHGALAVYTAGKIKNAKTTPFRLTAAQSLIDDIINSVNNLVYQGISSLESGLSATPPDRLGFAPDPAACATSEDGPEFPEAKQEIEEGLHKLETLLESTVDKNFDRFEIYVLRNILSVPQDLAGWIRLAHYEVCGTLEDLVAELLPCLRSGPWTDANKHTLRTCIWNTSVAVADN